MVNAWHQHLVQAQQTPSSRLDYTLGLLQIPQCLPNRNSAIGWVAEAASA